MTARALIAGVGNVFLGDDGFGVEVARRLSREPLPAGVEVTDFGVRGIHLAYELLCPPDLLIVADAVCRGGAPGTLYLIEPLVETLELPEAADAHGMDLGAVFARVEAMGGRLPRTRIVGCEPADLSARMELSEPIRRAVEPAARLIRDQINRELAAPAPKEDHHGA